MKKNLKYITKNSSTIMVRVPNTKQVNFHKLFITAAIEERDRLCREQGLNPKKGIEKRIFMKITSRKTNSLPVGICYYKDINLMICGYQVGYKEENKYKNKRFSYFKYGSDSNTLKQAIKYRNEYEERKLKEIELGKEAIRKHGFNN